jgi:hypothetical protein
MEVWQSLVFYGIIYGMPFFKLYCISKILYVLLLKRYYHKEMSSHMIDSFRLKGALTGDFRPLFFFPQTSCKNRETVSNMSKAIFSQLQKRGMSAIPKG